MDTKDIEFKVLREGDRVVGFSLVGTGETEAQCFCRSFPKAMRLKKASVGLKDRKIHFRHEGLYDPTANIFENSSPGYFAIDISESEESSLRNLLDGAGEYRGKQLAVTYVTAWGKGFELRAK